MGVQVVKYKAGMNKVEHTNTLSNCIGKPFFAFCVFIATYILYIMNMQI